MEVYVTRVFFLRVSKVAKLFGQEGGREGGREGGKEGGREGGKEGGKEVWEGTGEGDSFHLKYDTVVRLLYSTIRFWI